MPSMRLHQAARLALALLALAFTLTAARAESTLEGYGVLVMHGKGGRPGLFGREWVRALQSRGALVLEPSMPWSGERGVMRDLTRTVPEMVVEIGRHVKTLREKGATHIVVAGHSLGAAMALAYAASPSSNTGDSGASDLAALVLLAPGHTPDSWTRISALSLGVLQARALVEAGRGGEMDTYLDINQGRQSWIRASAQGYLSLYDPQGPAVMPLNAARVPANLPVLVVIGDRDPLFNVARRYLFDRLPENRQSRLVEVKAGHIETPDVGSEAVLTWLEELRSLPH